MRSQASITESSFGLSYLADEGHVLISGRETVLLDAEIGYSTYLEWIETTTRSVMAGGSAEDYIFLWMPDFDPLASARGDSYDPSVHRAALVYNHADKVLLRFRLGSASHVQYAAGGRLDDGSRIFCYTGEKELYWPSTADKDDGETFHSKVVVWLNDQPSATKTIRSLTVEYGDVDQGLSGPEVSVRAMEHWNDPNRNAVLVVAGSTNHRGIDVRNRRENYQEFMGMQGRYFEITVRTNSGTDGSTWDSGLFDVVAITVEYDSDVEEGHHGAPGENS